VPDFTVIDGGGGSERERRFRENPHAVALWDAIYPQPATSYAEIARKMGVPVHTANNTIHHVRDHAENYGWTIPHAQKGREGEFRSYFPVMLDGTSPALRTVRSKECFKAGSLSSCKTIASMAEHAAVATEAASNTESMTSAQKRKLRAAAGMFTAASEMAQRVFGELGAFAA
jgi:hypothetical protein